MRDVLKNVDVTMPARTSIPASTGKNLHQDVLNKNGLNLDKPYTISCSASLSLNTDNHQCLGLSMDF